MSTTEPIEQRTPEQHDAVRRRSLPLAISGAVCGALGLVLLLGKTIAIHQPPAVFAVNLSFCAMMMGVGILFYIKGTRGVGAALTASIVAILCGIAGPLIYARQSMVWHQLVETRELKNAETIAKAAADYGRQHRGDYPPDLSPLLLDEYINLDAVTSPFGSLQKPADTLRLHIQLITLRIFRRHQAQLPPGFAPIEGPLVAHFARQIDALADYQYFGTGLSLPSSGTDPKATLPEEIIIVTSKGAIMRRQLTVGFADGRAVFLDLENAESALRSSDQEREALGFPAIRPPDVVQKAQQYKDAPRAPSAPRR